MLNVSLLATFFALQAATPRHEPVIPTPDWRSEFPIKPLRSTLTAEWLCSANGRPSRVVIRIDDVGANIRNHRFSAKVGSLMVEGRAASPTVLNRVSAALAELNSVSYLQGACRDRAPALEIKGFAIGAGRQPEKSSTIDLK